MRGLFVVALIAAAPLALRSQPAATLTVESLLRDRLGVPAGDVARFANGETLAQSLPGTVGHEIGAAGAIRAKGDMRRLVAWIRDIEAFMKASGVENVGAIHEPATAADFSRVNLDDVDFSDLAACRPGKCDVRMPAAYLERFQKEVDFKAADANQRAAALTRALIADYVLAYQKGGDAGLGAHHDSKAAQGVANEFQDLLRRSTKVWDLAYPFVSYLETYPKAAPAGTESRFYWTRDKIGRKPTLTLHHVVLSEFPDGRVLVADKQFYASRDLDAALMIALAVPTADRSGFDLVVSVKARAQAAGGAMGRVLRGRIDKEMVEGLKTYLEWIRGSAGL
jgi:hypothetical protein